jgi:outer membrane protein OmpA-like peptidoglycan-associated protein
MMVEYGGQLAQWRIKPSGRATAFDAPFCLVGASGVRRRRRLFVEPGRLDDPSACLFCAAVRQCHPSARQRRRGIDTNRITAVAIVVGSRYRSFSCTAHPGIGSVQATTGLTIRYHRFPKIRPRRTEDPVEPLNREIMKSLEDSFSNDFYVRWDQKQPVFVLGERITFNVGDAMLLADSQSALKRIADLIAPLRHYRVIVSGHTDDAAIRTPIFPSNWELSAARAASVAKYLASNGVAPQQLVIQGKSEFHPLVANTSAAHRRTNRRVEIYLEKGRRTPDIP